MTNPTNDPIIVPPAGGEPQPGLGQHLRDHQAMQTGAPEPYRPAPVEQRSPLYGAPPPASSFKNAPLAAKILGVTGIVFFATPFVAVIWTFIGVGTAMSSSGVDTTTNFALVPWSFALGFVGFVLMAISNVISRKH